MSSASSDQWHIQAGTPELNISGGLLRVQPGQTITEENEAGLKLVLLLGGGAVRYRMSQAPAAQLQGPALHLSLSSRPFVVNHSFHADTPVHYVAIRMPEQALENWLDMDAADWSRRQSSPAGPFILDSQADKPLQALARQLLLCPLQGGLRQLYLSGKALELTATVLATLDARSTASSAASINLPARQRDCLQQARALLLQELSQPPGLDWLAARVGLSVTLLTRGFRQMFGMSVYEFVREQRLEQAYRMLATGACSVSQAAGACGYSDSHFSKIFQKRYGIPPRALRR